MTEDKYLTGSHDQIIRVTPDSESDRERLQDEISQRVAGQIRKLEGALSQELDLDTPLDRLTSLYIDTYLTKADSQPVKVREGQIGNVRVTAFSGGPSNETAIEAARETLGPLMDSGARVKVFGAQVSVTFSSKDGNAQFSYTHGTPVVNSSSNRALAKGSKGIEVNAYGVNKQIHITPNPDGTNGVMILRRDDNTNLVSDVSVFSPNPFFSTSEVKVPLTIRKIRGQGSIGGSYHGINPAGDTSLSDVVVSSPDGTRRRWEGKYDHKSGQVIWDKVIENRQEIDREELEEPSVRLGDVPGTLELQNDKGQRVGQIRIHENVFNHIPNGVVAEKEAQQLPEST